MQAARKAAGELWTGCKYKGNRLIWTQAFIYHVDVGDNVTSTETTSVQFARKMYNVPL